MRKRNIGVYTISIGLIAIGVSMMLYFSGRVSLQVFSYVGPALLILFGLEVVANSLRQSEERAGYSKSSVFLIIVVMLASMSQLLFPGGLPWHPQYAGPVNGQIELDQAVRHVEIRIPSGKITVTGTMDNTLSYHGELAVPAVSQDDARKQLEEHWTAVQDGDTLTLSLDPNNAKFSLFQWIAWWDHTSYLNVEVPQALLTKIQTKNGSVEVNHMRADTDIKTSNGKITVTDVQGNVTGDSSNGAVTIKDIGGSANVSTSNGPISLTNIAGAVIASSSNGQVIGESAVHDGWEIKTSNGKITLTLPREADATIQASTSNGHFGGDVDWNSERKNKSSATLGSGKYSVVLSTSNGSVNVNFGP